MNTIKELTQEEYSGEDIAAIVEVMRESDRIFENTGGGTRHYIRDVFLPLLETKGFYIVKLEDAKEASEECANQSKWINSQDCLPEKGQLCDVWLVSDGNIPAHRRINYVFTHNVGVRQEPAFQDKQAFDFGLYEEAYFVNECIITHWMPSPEEPKFNKP